MLGFRTNVSLEQQMPGSSDSRDDDLNYNITIQLVTLWKSYSKKHDCCKSSAGQHVCRNAKVPVVHTMQQLQPELANVGREYPNDTKRIFCSSSPTNQYYLQMHRDARKQCQILQGCDQRGSAHQDELSGYIAIRGLCKSSADKKRLSSSCSQLNINQQKGLLLAAWRKEACRDKLKARRESIESHQQHIESVAIDTCQIRS